MNIEQVTLDKMINQAHYHAIKHAASPGGKIWMKKHCVDVEDLEQTAILRVLSYYDNWDLANGEINTYMGKHCFGAIQDLRRRYEQRRRERGVGIFPLSNRYPIEGAPDIVTEPTVDDDIYWDEMKGVFDEVIDELPDQQQKVLRLYYWEGKDMSTVGTELGIGESRVSQVHTKALKTIQRRFGNRLRGLMVRTNGHNGRH